MKIVILGPPGCGKSSIFNYLCFDSIQPEKTVGCDYAMKRFVIGNKAFEIFVWDVAGSELESSLMKVYLRDAMGVFFVADVQERETLDLV